MQRTKKADAAKAAEAETTQAGAAETVSESIKTEEKAAEPQETPKKRPGRPAKSAAEKAAAKAASEKAAAAKTASEKTPTGKAAAEKTTAKTAAKAAGKGCIMYVQFAGKSYAEEDLVKIAKDVWKYDLKQKAGALETIELYVKPEESKVYYVMNGEFTGNFAI